VLRKKAKQAELSQRNCATLDIVGYNFTLYELLFTNNGSKQQKEA